MTAIKRITLQEPLPQLERAREPLLFIVFANFGGRKDLFRPGDQGQGFFLFGVQHHFAQSCFNLIGELAHGLARGRPIRLERDAFDR